jgi:hypothetical protein
MSICPRYFATVRRAISKPFSLSAFASASSLRGLDLSSPSMISCSAALIALELTSSPLSVAIPPVKNPRSGSTPCGREQVLLRHRPAHRRDVHAQLLGDLRHRQRLEGPHPVVERLALRLDHRLHDPQQRPRRCSTASMSHCALLRFFFRKSRSALGTAGPCSSARTRG